MSATHVGWCATRPENAPKTYEKPFQNDVRTLLKSMLKTFGLSTSIFSGLSFDLGWSWALPSVSWAPLGRSWAALGRSWPALGPVLGASLVLLGASWRSNEAPGSIFKALQSSGKHFGSLCSSSSGGIRLPRLMFQLLWVSFCDVFFGLAGVQLRTALRAAVHTVGHVLGIFLLLLWCGGLCAAHGNPSKIRRTAGSAQACQTNVF